LGYEFNRTHNVITAPARITKKHKYQMSCGCVFKVTTMIHNKIQEGNSGYMCKKHHQHINPGDYVVITLKERLEACNGNR
jgi:hypothetical protein